MNLLYINLLQGAGAGSQGMLMLVIMAVFFAFMIWPQMRRQKKAKNFVAGLEKGDKVVTTGGIHGKISQIGEKQITLDLEEGKMKIDPTGISMENTQAVYPKEAAAK